MTDNGARALAERLRQNGIRVRIPGLVAGPDQIAERLLANGAAFLPDAAELDRLQAALRDARDYIMSNTTGDPARSYVVRHIDAALDQPEGSAGTDPGIAAIAGHDCAACRRSRTNRATRAAEGSARDGG